MPVYNGGGYLKKTIDSILQQTYSNFELICVDDGSTDNSCSIIEDYIKRDQRIRLLKKNREGCVPFSWLFVLPYIRGQFVCYTSQDDLFSSDLLQKEYERQLQTNADAILPDVVAYTENGRNDNGYFGLNGNRDVVLTGREACVYSLNWSIHGFALFRTDIVRKVGFVTNTLNSDEFVIRKLYYNCKEVVFCKGVFYYRQDNVNAITKKPSLRRLEYIETNKMILNFLLQNKFTSHEIAIFRTYAFVELITLQVLLFKNKDKFKNSEYYLGLRKVKEEYQICDKQGLKFMKYSSLKNLLLCKRYDLFYLTCRVYSLIH